jgi:hypothetical protein
MTPNTDTQKSAKSTIAINKPVAFALKELTATEEARIVALVTKAMS